MNGLDKAAGLHKALVQRLRQRPTAFLDAVAYAAHQESKIKAIEASGIVDPMFDMRFLALGDANAQLRRVVGLAPSGSGKETWRSVYCMERIVISDDPAHKPHPARAHACRRSHSWGLNN